MLNLNEIYFILNDRLLTGPDISFQIGITEKVKCMKKRKYRYYDKYLMYISFQNFAKKFSLFS